MRSDDEITVAQGAHERHVVLVCGSAAFGRLMGRLAGEVRWPEDVAADDLKMIEIHNAGLSAARQPVEQDWRGRVALVGCVVASFMVAAVFVVGIVAIVGWLRG